MFNILWENRHFLFTHSLLMKNYRQNAKRTFLFNFKDFAFSKIIIANCSEKVHTNDFYVSESMHLLLCSNWKKSSTIWIKFKIDFFLSKQLVSTQIWHDNNNLNNITLTVFLVSLLCSCLYRMYAISHCFEF